MRTTIPGTRPQTPSMLRARSLLARLVLDWPPSSDNAADAALCWLNMARPGYAPAEPSRSASVAEAENALTAALEESSSVDEVELIGYALKHLTLDRTIVEHPPFRTEDLL